MGLRLVNGREYTRSPGAEGRTGVLSSISLIDMM